MTSTLDRRRLLLGGAGAAALALTPGLTSAVAAPTGAAAALIRRDYLKYPSWPTKERTGYNGYGMGVHPNVTSYTFDSSFHTAASNWAKHLDDLCRQAPHAGYRVGWFGCAGVYVNKPGQHGEARAFDLTAAGFTNGQWVDCNISYRSGAGLLQQRRYVAVATSLRVRFAEVGTAGTGGGHENHIHFDPDNTIGPGLSQQPYDTFIVQRACAHLNGEQMAIDGDWGPQTQGAYERLLRRVGVPRCAHPMHDYWDMAKFLLILAKTGLNNQPAGAFQWDGSC